ncbi:MAG: hypothetical protein ACRCZF_22410, partial [Gemmataceae bacterium]
HAVDPEFIVLEQPQLWFQVPAAEQLRRVILQHPELYEKCVSIPYQSGHELCRDARIEIYRKRNRNPNPMSRYDLPILGLGGSLQIQK